MDKDVVEIDPTRIEVWASSAWARFNKGDVAEEAKKLLRDAALEVAKKDWEVEKAETNARDDAQKLFAPLVRALQPDVKLDIQFRP